MTISNTTTYYCWTLADGSASCYTIEALPDFGYKIYKITTGNELPTPTEDYVTEVATGGNSITCSDGKTYNSAPEGNITMTHEYYAWYSLSYGLNIYTTKPLPSNGDDLYIVDGNTVVYVQDKVDVGSIIQVLVTTSYSVYATMYDRNTEKDLLTTVEELGIKNSEGVETIYRIRDAQAVADAMLLRYGKQDTLVSGTNIKTINGTSLLGSGNIDTEHNTIFAINSGNSDLLINNGTSLGFNVSASNPLVYTDVLGNEHTATSIDDYAIRSYTDNGVCKVVLSYDSINNKVSGFLMEMSKHPFYIGSNEPGFMSGFSETNYLTITDTFNPQTDFDIIMSFKTDSSVDDQALFSSTGSSTVPTLMCRLTNGKVIAGGCIDGTGEEELFMLTSVTTLQPNTYYAIRLKYTSTDGYSLSVGTSLSSLTVEATSSVTTQILQNQGLIMCVGESVGEKILPFEGILDRKNTYVELNGVNILSPLTYSWLNSMEPCSFKMFNGSWVDYSSSYVVLVDSEVTVVDGEITSIIQPTYNYNGMSKSDAKILEDINNVPTSVIQLFPNASIYSKTISSATAFSFDTVSLGTTIKDKVITFELYLTMNTVYALTFPSSVTWIETPDFTNTGKYLLVFRSFDGGTSWLGNLEVQWS